MLVFAIVLFSESELLSPEICVKLLLFLCTVDVVARDRLKVSTKLLSKLTIDSDKCKVLSVSAFNGLTRSDTLSGYVEELLRRFPDRIQLLGCVEVENYTYDYQRKCAVTAL